jgi:hypothetical protein
MQPMVKELFIEPDADDRGQRRTGGAAYAGPSEPDRPWSSGPDGHDTGPAIGSKQQAAKLTSFSERTAQATRFGRPRCRQADGRGVRRVTDGRLVAPPPAAPTPKATWTT